MHRSDDSVITPETTDPVDEEEGSITTDSFYREDDKQHTADDSGGTGNTSKTSHSRSSMSHHSVVGTAVMGLSSADLHQQQHEIGVDNYHDRSTAVGAQHVRGPSARRDWGSCSSSSDSSSEAGSTRQQLPSTILLLAEVVEDEDNPELFREIIRDQVRQEFFQLVAEPAEAVVDTKRRSICAAIIMLLGVVVVVVAMVAVLLMPAGPQANGGNSDILNKNKTKLVESLPYFVENQQLKDAVVMYLNDSTLTARYGDTIDDWDVSRVTDFSFVFSEKNEIVQMFDEYIGSWNVSGATAMRAMFNGARDFDQDLSAWDVSKVRDMEWMFRKTKRFNQRSLQLWNTSSVRNMRGMFARAGSFNQDLSSWDVSRVTNFKEVFAMNEDFNQDISSWNVQNAIVFVSMFSGASSFRQNLCGWLERMPVDARVQEFFSGTACPNQTTPILPYGPMCFQCGV